MAVGQETLWNRFLKPVFGFLINNDEIRHLKQSINWETKALSFCDPDLTYPDYYRLNNFHGIKGGYLNIEAAVTYDPITQYILVPNETWVRQGVIDAIGGQPGSIVDLGCGTGSTTLMLKRAFPDAQIMGVDLSPYMLVMANYKASREGLKVEWRHGNAQKTGLPSSSFDVVTASLLFHETPPQVAQSILGECFRLLVPGGQVIILDGNQKTLRDTNWLTEIFEEPYIKAYSNESVEAQMGAAGFEEVQTQDLWMIHQVTRGIKPLPISESMRSDAQPLEISDPIPVF